MQWITHFFDRDEWYFCTITQFIYNSVNKEHFNSKYHIYLYYLFDYLSFCLHLFIYFIVLLNSSSLALSSPCPVDAVSFGYNTLSILTDTKLLNMIPFADENLIASKTAHLFWFLPCNSHDIFFITLGHTVHCIS